MTSLPTWMTESKPSSSLTEECPPSHRKWVVIGTCASVTTAIVALLWPFISPALRKVCLPYVPATPAQVSNVLTGLSNRPLPSRLLDIGSGDGRIVMATAGAGFQSTGVEINPWLVLYSRLSARRSLPRPVSRQTSFVRRDLWKFPLSSYDNVVVFGVEEMMPPLKEKMEAELKSGARVVACRFPIHDWTPALTIGEGVDTVWVYDR